MPIKQIHPHTQLCLERETGRGYSLITTVGCAYVDMARGLLAKRVYDVLAEYQDIDTVMFIDEDMRWAPEDIDTIVQMVRILRLDNLTPLLHATYARRGDGGECCHERLLSESLSAPRDLVIRSPETTITLPPVVGGLGFCCIHRDGFLRFAARVNSYRVVSADAIAIDMFPTGVIHGQWYGEDILHCIRQCEFGNGSYWLKPLMVEHMSSTYGSPFAPRYPSDVAVARLAGQTEPHRQQHNESDQNESEQHAPG